MASNLNDIVLAFEAHVELVHQFTNGDNTVVVNGDAGTYPSLAKIALDSQDALSLVIITNQDTSDAAILAGQQTIAQMISDAQIVIAQILHDAQLALDKAAALLLNQQALSTVKTYYYDQSMSWNIKHNMLTDLFTVTIINSNKDFVYAPITIIDNTEFKVDFTDMEAGSITVQFFF
jgi:hypothetical protein